MYTWIALTLGNIIYAYFFESIPDWQNVVEHGYYQAIAILAYIFLDPKKS